MSHFIISYTFQHVLMMINNENLVILSIQFIVIFSIQFINHYAICLSGATTLTVLLHQIAWVLSQCQQIGRNSRRTIIMMPTGY